ncbi:hypothetical protein [Colwellia sp. RSH04]|nr:hypothetical protein [Colwellia sp. RSH04]
MMKNIYQQLTSMIYLFSELKHISISQWDIEQNEHNINTGNIRQQR